MAQTAWLIEWPANKHDPVRYWHASEPRVMDPNDATAFARKVDAEAMMVDWALYLHPPEGAPGDAGTAPCPDCQGSDL